ncbi:caspase family protein [Bradyrhizobium sp. AUGA SZCCT0240]|nr:caspase family protein [Bradyrhizobium sp. AUGA SZCCT0158]MBR1238986.1 caspase family protein [Bradyrhizobium sp. AUGA SZCCT0274]MBR1255799.1 caspase family protein [Bradyrhizobium sp. AUGA SZCCT0240]
MDLDRSAFDRAIQTFGNELTGADVALFYYAGHGVQVRNVNYLVPISANAPQGQGEIRQELAEPIVPAADGYDTNLVRSGEIKLPDQRRAGIQPFQSIERQEVLRHRIVRIRHQVWPRRRQDIL